MKWVLDNQKTIKAEKYNGLLDAANTGDLANAGVDNSTTNNNQWIASFSAGSTFKYKDQAQVRHFTFRLQDQQQEENYQKTFIKTEI